jgi:hypothetical protein
MENEENKGSKGDEGDEAECGLDVVFRTYLFSNYCPTSLR